MLKNNSRIYGDISQLGTAILSLVKCGKIITSEPVVWHDEMLSLQEQQFPTMTVKKVLPLRYTLCQWYEDMLQRITSYQDMMQGHQESKGSEEISFGLHCLWISAARQKYSSCRGGIVSSQKDIGVLNEMHEMRRKKDDFYASMEGIEAWYGKQKLQVRSWLPNVANWPLA